MREMVRNMDLSHAPQKHLNAEYLKGLINVVPLRGAGDKAGRFCVGRCAIHMYCKLLEQRQELYSTYCRKSVFLQPHDQVMNFIPTHSFVALSLALREVCTCITVRGDSNVEI